THVPPPRVPGDVSPRSKLTLLMLCLTLGPFGVHDIYIGKWEGFFLKFFTANWLLIGWFTDIAKVIRGTYWDREERPVSEWRIEPAEENKRKEWTIRIIVIALWILGPICGKEP
ncbi:MAG: TM2 domain-containing protein, partial [Abditibacteriota bacterium]|nr:TM2 domain-containing protein [Abditibacteriota bacterium]